LNDQDLINAEENFEEIDNLENEEENEEALEAGELDESDENLGSFARTPIGSIPTNLGVMLSEEDDDMDLDEIDNILELAEEKYPRFTLAKNKARFLRMVSWYRGKEEWIEVAPVSGVTKLFKQQTKELEGIRSSKLDYEMELETGTLTPSQRSYRRDELKMCKVQEKMAVHLISKLQVKIKSGRR
jgi:hypothetical protein